VKAKRRVTWIQLSQHAQVVALEGRTLTLGFNNPGARESFVNGRSDVILQQVLIDLVGQDWKIDAIVDPSAQPGVEPPIQVIRPAAQPAAQPASQQPASQQPASQQPASQQTPGQQTPGQQPSQQPPPEGAWPGPTTGSTATPGAQTATEPAPQSAAQPSPRQRAEREVRESRAAGPSADRSVVGPSDEDAHRDDPDADEQLHGAELLSERLGAQIIEEIPHN
jgi:DNA polymerase-3 subunit gamma/tau